MGTEITIAGRKYPLVPRTIRASKEWRTKFAEPFALLVDVLKGAPGLELTQTNGATGKESVNLAGIASLADSVKGVLLGSAEMALDMVCDYVQAAQADREFILDNGYDSEIFAALLEVLKVVYPFGGLLDYLKGVGPAESATLKNSPGTPGASATSSRVN